MSSDSSSSSENAKAASKRKPPPDVEIASDDDESSGSGSDQDEDVGVLSHAERRRQKKRELKTAKAVEATTKKRKLNDGSAARNPSTGRSPDETKLKRQNSVWVGNLSYQTTRDMLKQYFDGVGEITRIHMPQRPGTSEILG